ncbi:hypothetical protein LLH00_09580 [bacterium]|nr:hypothetical protein [bacterium]
MDRTAFVSASHTLRRALIAALLSALLAAGCNNGAARIEVDLLDHVNPGASILVENVGSGGPESERYFSWRIDPSTVDMPLGTSKSLDVDRVELTFEGDLSADKAAQAELTIFLDDGSSQVYSDSLAFTLSSRASLPAHFKLTSIDPRLNRIFGRERFFLGLRLTFIRPSDSGTAVAELAIGKFSALVTGRQVRY